MTVDNFAELFGAVFPAIGEVQSGVDYGPTGADYTGVGAVGLDLQPILDRLPVTGRAMTLDEYKANRPPLFN